MSSVLPPCCRNISQEALDEQIRQSAEKQVRGSLIKSRLLYIQCKYNTARLQNILKRLSKSEQGLLTGPVLISHWYPLGLLIRLDRAIAQELGGNPAEVFEELGSFSADLNLGGAMDPLLKKDVTAFLQLSSVMDKAFHDFSPTMQLTETPTESGHQAYIQLEYLTPPPAHYCQSGVGYFRQAVRLCGGRNVQVDLAACSQEKGSVCQFLIKWDA